jgi:hypothetical protein
MITLSGIRLVAGPAAAENRFLPKAIQSSKRANWFDQLGLAGLLTHFPEGRKASPQRPNQRRQFFEKQGKMAGCRWLREGQPVNHPT